MGNMSQALRFRRYSIKPDAALKFQIQGTSGQTYELKIANLSLNGIAAEVDQAFVTNEMVEPGTILPSAKLIASNTELAVGRLAIRTIPSDWSKNKIIGFSFLDTKLPLQGKLSHFLDMELGKNSDPTELEIDPEKFNLAHFAENDETSVDLFAKTKAFSTFHRAWVQTEKHGYYRIRTPSRGSRVHLTDKRSNGRTDYLSVGSNDYLGLANSPEVENAASQALKEYGFGSTGSPTTSGLTLVHIELQEELCRLFKSDDCLLFNSGYSANLGIIDGLSGPSDLLVADMISHASIQDAMRMARATSRYFKHNDLAHLTKILGTERHEASGCLIITEGVFSMDGDVPPLKEMYQIARHNNARIMIDEAHSFGVIGQSGLGACDEAGLLGKVDIIMGTFSKICGGIGGFVCGERSVIDWLRYYSRSHMFSVSIPPSTAAAALAALKIFQRDKTLITKLRANIKHFTDGIREIGIDISTNHRSPVIPVVIGDEKIMGKIHQDLINAGIFVIPIVFPAVGRKNCRFRFTMTAELTTSDIDYVLTILKQSFDKHGFESPKFSQAAS